MRPPRDPSLLPTITPFALLQACTPKSPMSRLKWPSISDTALTREAGDSGQFSCTVMHHLMALGHRAMT
jgi:hypothetical protein